MDNWLKSNLICPRDHSSLDQSEDFLMCPNNHRYPIIEGIPVMLVKEAEPTIAACYESFENLGNYQNEDINHIQCDTQNIVDTYVQEWVAATCGLIYRPIINNIKDYPIPDLILPNGLGEYLLDIGCGWGRWCISASKKGYNPVGIDPSFDAIMAARRVCKQMGIKSLFVVGDSRYLPFKSDSFNKVFSYSVLQHFKEEDVRNSLVEIKRVLKINGECNIQMPNLYGLRNLYNQLKRGFRKPRSFEVRYWSLSELQNVFSKCIGPTSISVDAYFGLGIQKSDLNLLELRYKIIVLISEFLKKMSFKLKWMKYLADSIYVKSLSIK